MKDAEIVKLAEAFLEEAASKGAGVCIDRPAYKALQAALRPIRVQQPPPDVPKKQDGFVPAAFSAGSDGKEQITPAEHSEHLAEIKFEKGLPTDKPAFSKN